MSSNPYQAPLADTQAVVGVLSGEWADLRRVAVYQKGLIFSIGVSVVCYMALALIGSMANGPPGGLLLLIGLPATLGLLVTALSGTAFVFLLSIKVNGVIWGIVMGLASLVPCVGMLALLLVNERGTKVLRANGIKVGFFGARMSDLPAG